MATQEERITALERTTREHQAVLQTLSYDLITVKGHIITQGDTIQEIKDDIEASFKQLAASQINLENQIDARFDLVDARFSQVDTRFNQVDARFDLVDARFSQIDTRFNQVDARFSQVDTRFNQVEARLDKIEATMATKDDIANMATKDDLAAMENRILNAFQQLVAMVNTQ